MYWSFISKRVLQDLEHYNTSIVQPHKTMTHQTVKVNHSFEQQNKRLYSANKFRCQSSHEIQDLMVTSKYQRFHDIQIELPMIRRKRLANILSNPNDYCQRSRNNKKGTLAGTILKKYKDIRMNNSGTDRIMQYSIQTQDQMMITRKSINQSQSKIYDRKCSNGSSSPKLPSTISPITPVGGQNRQKFIIRTKIGQSVDFEKKMHIRQLQPLADVDSSSPREIRQIPNKPKHLKTTSCTSNDLYTINRVYGNLSNKKLPKSIFKVQ